MAGGGPKPLEDVVAEEAGAWVNAVLTALVEPGRRALHVRWDTHIEARSSRAMLVLTHEASKFFTETYGPFEHNRQPSLYTWSLDAMNHITAFHAHRGGLPSHVSRGTACGYPEFGKVRVFAAPAVPDVRQLLQFVLLRTRCFCIALRSVLFGVRVVLRAAGGVVCIVCVAVCGFILL